MKPGNLELANELNNKLTSFSENIRPLPGIDNPVNKQCLVAQMVDSIRRIKYISAIRDKQLESINSNPQFAYFDPLKAASWHKQQGNIDEAFWLIFLSTHFGKNKNTGWNLCRDVYGKLENQVYWSWPEISENFDEFRPWLHENQEIIKSRGSFGNHRKYQSLDAYSPTGTGSTIGSYVDWVGPENHHLEKIDLIIQESGPNPRDLFYALYKSMDSVVGFGRTGKFDFLTMAGKFGLVNIEPGSTYMHGATGPKSGAKLLFGGSVNANISDAVLNSYLGELETHMGLYFGMQVLEDSICNWQKDPTRFTHFAG